MGTAQSNYYTKDIIKIVNGDYAVVSVTKFYLIYKAQPDMDYNTLNSRLWDIQYQIRQLKNTASAELWIHTVKKNDGYQEPDLYNLAKEKLPFLNTGNIACVKQQMMKKFSSECKDILSGKRSVSSFGNNQPIVLHNKSIFFYEEDNKYYVRLSLFSREGVKEYGLESGMCTFEIFHKCKSSIPIIERCISGEYKHCTSEIQYDKSEKKWCMALAYQFDPEMPELNPKRVMGIDLGVCVPIAAAINDSEKEFMIGSNEIERYRAKNEEMRRQIYKSRPVAGEGSVGHGYKTRMAPAERIGKRIANFRDTKNHAWSRWIVDIAVKNQCGVIQMEDLSGIADAKGSKFLKKWSYYDLQHKIEYKAKAKGIKVKYINPKYTSQRCSSCGYISDHNRVDRDHFVCERCGFTKHADKNSAHNICLPNIEYIIEKSAKVKCT